MMEMLATGAILGVCLWVALACMAAVCSRDVDGGLVDEVFRFGCLSLLLLIPLGEILFAPVYVVYKLLGGE